ncbi:MAG: beta-1,6-N-acetylglucosaminyltransferase [Pseudomonadota bacterium]
MTTAYLVLAHENMAETAGLIRLLSTNGRAVAVHVDARADIAPLDGVEAIRVKRRRCAWGMFSLVEATLDGLGDLIAADAAFTHVTLVSGAHMPLRPLDDLDGYLSDKPGRDIIESVELAEKRWVMDGLSEERFHLHHPFNWRTQRTLFDWNVEVQRALKIKRRPPDGLTLALGSQWWCLSRETIAAILADSQLPWLKRFFRRVWIPDESFFQSLVRRHSAGFESLSPTLAQFDSRGLPYVFYDDHIELLSTADHFFARKIHPRADGLRAELAERALAPSKTWAFTGAAPNEEFIRARRSRTHGRRHLISPARFPRIKGKKKLASAFPYTVIGGVGGETAAMISRELTRRGDITAHARLFAPGDVRFHADAPLAAGALPASHQARDFWPDQYVINLARGAAGGAVAFCLAVEDREAIGDYIATDPGAKVIWYSGAWALDLYRRADKVDAVGLTERATAASVAERDQLSAFRQAGAALTIRSAAMLIDNPGSAVAEMLNLANARPSKRKLKAPDFTPPRWSRARPFLRTLQRSGVEIEAGLLDDA